MNETHLQVPELMIFVLISALVSTFARFVPPTIIVFYGSTVLLCGVVYRVRRDRFVMHPAARGATWFAWVVFNALAVGAHMKGWL